MQHVRGARAAVGRVLQPAMAAIQGEKMYNSDLQIIVIITREL